MSQPQTDAPVAKKRRGDLKVPKRTNIKPYVPDIIKLANHGERFSSSLHAAAYLDGLHAILTERLSDFTGIVLAVTPRRCARLEDICVAFINHMSPLFTNSGVVPSILANDDARQELQITGTPASVDDPDVKAIIDAYVKSHPFVKVSLRDQQRVAAELQRQRDDVAAILDQRDSAFEFTLRVLKYANDRAAQYAESCDKDVNAGAKRAKKSDA